jgi:aldose 1-epimerase
MGGTSSPAKSNNCPSAERGTGVAVDVDNAIRWLQVYTADDSPGAQYRQAIAIEPMTCPPDAFNSGVDLLALDSDASMQASWRIRALSP